MVKLEELVQYAKTNGFIYQGSEIYGGLANTWDYGPLGSLLKNNIKSAWIAKFQKETKENVLLDSSILLNTDVWKASGHLGNFSDPLTECRSCNQRFRADNLIEQFDKTNADGWSNEKMYQYILSNKIPCPSCGAHDFLPIRSFNMMFQTYQGVVMDSANQIYLRPETAQGIFINFKNILRTSRKKIPFGVCQVGKSFRNEITPGNFVFRTREFEQMELEFFCKPGTEKKWFNYWREKMVSFLTSLGIKNENLSLYDHPKEALSHYSNATTDIHFKFPWGFDELWGIASRTDFDLKAHQTQSKESMEYLDPETNERYIPYVVEPSVGVERLVLSFLLNGLEMEKLDSGEDRQVLHIHPRLAPYKVAVLPLVKKEHANYANDLYLELAKTFDCIYDETQNIGKRYRRQDSIGTYLCITVDHQTLIDDTVTVRNRDSMEQIRAHVGDLKRIIEETMIF
ncbi:glycine--tRNA ligase [Acholeplasma sp. OttesenSCG-928-E16]|nr:glycine--tRNA ligase [Acholeplasma sp. OttesenSCG-928-E16]